MMVVSPEEVRGVVLDRLSAALAAKGLEPRDVPYDFDLLMEGIIDSLGIVELITDVQQFFSIEVDFDGLAPEELTIIGPLCRYIASACTNGKHESAETPVFVNRGPTR
jgi:acyl carrier protein